MNTNHVTVSTLAKLQKQLQECYQALGAASTQNVRNVEPAHFTIVSCLPTKKGSAITANELFVAFRAKGGLVTRASFNSVLSTLVFIGKVNTVKFQNLPYQRYYFGLV